MPVGVLDHISIQVLEGPGAQLGRDVLVPEERLVPAVATRLLRKLVRLTAVSRRAERVAVGTVDTDADEVSKGLSRSVFDFLSLRRASAENGGNVNGDVLENGVGGGDGAEVATRPREGHPRRRGVHAVRGPHLHLRVRPQARVAVKA